MNTHLLSWNPDNWNWENIEDSIDTLNQTGYCSGSWSCGVNKGITKGDRLFLIKLGRKKTKGIIASGFASSSVYQSEHWNGIPGKQTNYINFEFDIILHPEKDKILEMKTLVREILSEQHWSTQNPGIRIKPHVAEELEELWFIT